MDKEQLESLYSRLDGLEKRLEDIFLNSKEALTFEQAWRYLRISASQLYKLVCKRMIPSFKPGGKLLYFKRTDLEGWMLSNRKKTGKEIKAEALTKLKKS